MSNGKIDKVKLSQLLRSGKSGKECAQFFNVTDSAISQARKELNINVVKSVQLESAHRVVDKNINAIAQLQKINERANNILDSLMKAEQGDSMGLKLLEAVIRKTPGGEASIERKYKDSRELSLRAMGEVRAQLLLQLDIFKTLYDLEMIADFQREVLTAIGEENIETRDRIIQRLKEGRALRSTIDIT